MKIAVYQSPIAATLSIRDAIAHVGTQLEWCDANGADILCCPETMLGGLADYSRNPNGIALGVADGELERLIAPLRHYSAACIIGFTERADTGELYNAAAVVKQGSLLGVYRKVHPAINSSVYTAGEQVPVFRVGPLCFGIMICRDSNYPELARSLVACGAAAIFIPSNNALPHRRATPDVVVEARAADMARATENVVPVARADVTGETESLRGYGSSGITSADGVVLARAPDRFQGCLVAEIPVMSARSAGDRT